MTLHVKSLAEIHDLLTQGAKETEGKDAIGTKEVIGRLAPLLQSIVGERRILFDVENVAIASRLGISLAIIVNEMVSNSVKHASGDIEVSLKTENDHITLETRDYGPGFTQSFDPRAEARTGMQLIESVSRWDLQGTCAFLNKEGGGARVVVEFPLPKSPAGERAASAVRANGIELANPQRGG
jgi:two-component sensor histidine kinase